MAIMLIDDESFSLKLIAHQLTALVNEELILHDNAVDALQVLEQSPEQVDLLFCDLRMPQMDGIEFVRHLGRIGFQGGVVLMSGQERAILKGARALAQAHQLHVLEGLQKPVTASQIKAIIAKRPSLNAVTCIEAPFECTVEELRQAIQQGQLINYYQPQIDVRSGELVGVEALVRWQHPEFGLIEPERFVPLAEQGGLIGELTVIVLARALELLQAWYEDGIQLTMSVNVSMESLTSLAFPDWLQEVADDIGVPLSGLVLEVTESRLVKDRQAALDILTRLRIKGVALSIDDFGTGYSSLAQLRDTPFNELKIDHGFVHDAYADPSLRIMFEASVNMATQLGMRAVAEGVETAEDWLFLQTTACDVAQGYYFAEPMPTTALYRWMETWPSRRQSLIATAGSEQQ